MKKISARFFRRVFIALLFFAGFLIFFDDAQAHQTSDSYLNLIFDANGASGRWDIRAGDLEYVVGLDDNDDGVISRDELLAHQQVVDAFTAKRLAINIDGK